MVRLMRALTLGCAGVLALAGTALADGEARVVVDFDLERGEVAEGVAVDWKGDVYTGLSGLGRMLRIPGGEGTAEEVMVLDGLAEGDFGFTGHAFNGDEPGYMYGLYAAVVSADPDLNGIFSIDPYGQSDPGNAIRHIEGTEAMTMANAIAFDEDGEHMYVSDSMAGAIWRLPLYGFVGYAEPEVWVANPLLEGSGAFGLGYPVGANGVAVRDGVVYVGVTEQGTVVRIPIGPDGAPGEPVVHAELPGVAVDGIAFDQAGNLYIADPPAHTLWKYAPDGTLTAVADVDDGLSGPSSVALWEDADTGEAVAYVSNQAIGPPPSIKHGPSIIAVTLE